MQVAAQANISAMWRTPKGMSMGLTTAAAPVLEVAEARGGRRLLDFHLQLSRLGLLINDELASSHSPIPGRNCSLRSSALNHGFQMAAGRG